MSQVRGTQEVRRAVRRAPKQPDLPRVLMTMVRAPATVAGARAEQTVSTHAHTARDRASAPSHFGTTGNASLPPHELSRVTEHVLRTLDRRVLSYRERSGRI
jgi:hypothetical protein